MRLEGSMHMTRTYSTLILAVLIGCGGCASSQRVVERPETLQQVNSALDGRRAEIMLTNGKRIRNAVNVRIGLDNTLYRPNGRSVPETLPTSAISRIIIVTGGKATRGMLIGSIPGLLLIAAGASAEEPESSPGVGKAIVVFGGAGVALVGMIVGGMMGNAAATKTTFVVYEGPIERYAP